MLYQFYFYHSLSLYLPMTNYQPSWNSKHQQTIWYMSSYSELCWLTLMYCPAFWHQTPANWNQWQWKHHNMIQHGAVKLHEWFRLSKGFKHIWSWKPYCYTLHITSCYILLLSNQAPGSNSFLKATRKDASINVQEKPSALANKACSSSWSC